MTEPIMIAAFAMAVAAPAVTVVSSPQLDVIGNCAGTGGRSFDLEKLLLLENRTALMEGSDGTLRVSVAGERVEILRLRPKSDGSVYITNIGYEVEPRADLDVELKLALNSGELVVYWKETYKNRIYRQGLFRIMGQHVAALCQGRGGFDSSK